MGVKGAICNGWPKFLLMERHHPRWRLADYLSLPPVINNRFAHPFATCHLRLACCEYRWFSISVGVVKIISMTKQTTVSFFRQYNHNWLTILGLLLLSFTLTAAGGKQASSSHFVEVGESWRALAGQYGLTVEALQAANFNPNPALQPAIGSTVEIPGGTTVVGLNGRLVRLFEGGAVSTAARAGLNPWRVVLENGLVHPYRPLYYQTIYLPGTSPLREFPPGFVNLELSSRPALPGQALGVRGMRETADTVSVWLDGRTADGFENDEHFVGLTATGAFLVPGNYNLDIQVGSHPLWSQPLRFVAGEWTFSQVILTGEAAEIDQESIQQERERLFAIWNQASPTPQWSRPFQLPIENFLQITSLYGARRSYNGGPYSSYHEGVDFSAYGGTPVFAPATGTVVVAERLYVRGGAVILDHGLGIYTGFYHLSEVVAQVGQVVEPGQLVGNVGTTGLSTGNHLHWDLLVNGLWVDGQAWVEGDMACWLLVGWGNDCPG